MPSHLSLSAALVFGLVYLAADCKCATTLPTDSLLQEYDICSPESASTSRFLSRPGDFIDIYVNWTYTPNMRHPHSCFADFKTCNNCRVKVNSVGPYFDYPECGIATWTEGLCAPGCVYFKLFDTYYGSHRRRFSSSLAADGFESQSKRLRIVACGDPVYPENITVKLRLTSVEKVQLITGNIFKTLSRRTFMSPYFPMPYVKGNEDYTYRFESSSQNGYITVTFDDWMLSPHSSIQFKQANIVNRISGSNFRPYIISDGWSMSMTFTTGEHRSNHSIDNFLGFKAVARFYSDLQDIPTIEIGCDYMIGASEGGIMHLTAAADGQNRDCIWIIKKLSGFDGVYMKIIRYKTRYELKNLCDYSLEVRGGVTSAADQRLLIRPNDHIPNYAVQLSEAGFYIRIKGCYFDDSVVISYAMYSNECDNYREYYKCDNGRCIPEHLKCDTYDHCGDGSDEIRSMCGRINSKVRTVSGEYPTNNVSNTSSGRYHYSLSIHVIIPLVVSIVLGIGILCLLIIFVRRCRKLSNNTFRNHPVNVHAQQARGRRCCWFNRGVRMSVTLSSGEHPPSYDEVMRSTPIGHFNMAFSGTPCQNTLSLPPSYEDAVTPVSGRPQEIEGNSSTICPDETNLTQLNAPLLQTATYSGTQPSAARSSGDTCVSYHRLNTSPSCNSHAIGEHSLIPNQFSFGICTASKNHVTVSFQQNVAKSGNGVKVVLESSICQNVNNENSFDECNNGEKKKGSKDGKCIVFNNGRNEDYEKNNRDINKSFHTKAKREDFGRIRDATCEKSRQTPNVVGELCDRQNADGEDAFPDILMVECSGDRIRNKSPDGESLDVCQEDFSNVDDAGDRSFLGSTGLNICSQRDSRSQSCVDLSLHSGRKGLLDVNKEELLEDKSISYAGTGDWSIERQSLYPYYGSRGMANKKLSEYLGKLPADNCDSMEASYSARQHRNREYESQDCDLPVKDRHRFNRAADIYKSGRDEHDVPFTLNPVLEPFLENPRHCSIGKVKLPDNTKQESDIKCNRFTDNSDKSNCPQIMIASNQWFQSPHKEDSSIGCDFEHQIMPDFSQDVPILNTRVSTHEDSRSRLQSSDTMTLIPSPICVVSEDKNVQNSQLDTL